MATGNRGEWSELYAVTHLLGNGGAFAGSSDQAAIKDRFYRVLELFLTSSNPLEAESFRISDDFVEVYAEAGPIRSIAKSDLERLSHGLLSEISDPDNSGSFKSPTGAEILELIGRTNPGAGSSQQTSDVALTVVDTSTSATSPRVGFSIKSQVGKPSTLLNASKATNFVFRLNGINKFVEPGKFEELNQLKLGARLEALSNMGIDLVFEGIESPQFRRNLKFVDSQLSEYLAKMLVTYYSRDSSSFSEVFDETASQFEDPEHALFKLRQFLGAVAMGLRPTNKWNGDVNSFRGLILAKTDGQVLIYYLYNLSEFQDYLFQEVKFETPSTSRHDFGQIFYEGDSHKLKLNLQVRFVR